MNKRLVIIVICILIASVTGFFIFHKKSSDKNNATRDANPSGTFSLQQYRQNVTDIQIGFISGNVYFLSLNSPVAFGKTLAVADPNNFQLIGRTYSNQPINVEISQSEKYVLSEEKAGEGQPNQVTVYATSDPTKDFIIPNAFQAHWLSNDRLIFASNDQKGGYQIKITNVDNTQTVSASTFPNVISGIQISPDKNKALITYLTGGGNDLPSNQALNVYNLAMASFTSLTKIPLIVGARWFDSDSLILKQVLSEDENPATQSAIVNIDGSVRQSVPIEGDLTQAIKTDSSIFYATSSSNAGPEGISSYELSNHLVTDWTKAGSSSITSVDQIVPFSGQKRILILSQTTLFGLTY